MESDEEMQMEEEFPVPGFSTLQDFSQTVLKKIVAATQKANGLSNLANDFEYWNSFPSFKEYCTEEGMRIINDIGELLRHQAVQCSWRSGTSSSKDTEERFDRLVDANDIMLENAGSLLDEAAGLKKNDTPILPPSIKQSSPIISTWNKKKDTPGRGRSIYKLLMAKNIQRPQLKWLDKIDNSNTPFVPYIKHKPHALKPLEEDYSRGERETDAISDFIHEQRVNSNKNRSHPYAYELSQFDPNNWQMEKTVPQSYSPLDETELTFIDTQDKLDDMLEKLKAVKEIAIDLEHHSYRSFQGFVCLMQISTRTEDFIVDTLKLRSELFVLNEVFTDPTILKVLHGSDHDIGWLQRDFGVYIVNMFDTGQAARVLQEARFSLAYLLQKYCDVHADKQYQLADWRIRELPEEMIHYAREDTHYLLFIYDVLRNQLIEQGNEMKNLLRSVYTKSNDICLTLYHKPMLYPDSYMQAYRKYRGRLNDNQLECFRLLYIWRDKTAREEDESCGYTLPNHMMFQIAENLPKEPPGILACCNPVPPLVRQRVMDIHQLVIQARDFNFAVVKVPESTNSKSNDNSKTLNSEIQDIAMSKSKSNPGRFHSQSGFERYKITGPPLELRTPSLTIFEEIVKEHIELTEGKRKANEILARLRSPFEMYLPNTGKEAVEPLQINENWSAASKEKVEASQKVKPTEKRKQKDEVTTEEQTLRDMLPKKRKKESIGTNDTPVKLDYLKNVKKTTDYVPFDYSKADLKKFSAGKTSTSTTMEVIDITEEPKVGKAIRTKVHSKSGARSMTSK